MGLETLLVKVGEGVGDSARGRFVLEDGVDGKAEGDYFNGEEAREDPRTHSVSAEGFSMNSVLTTLEGPSIC